MAWQVSDADQKARVERLLELAGIYQGCSRSELSQRLGRDVKNIVPDSGNPKLDLVRSLAQLLDWSIGDVAEALSGDPAGQAADIAGKNFEDVDADWVRLHRSGRYSEAVDLAAAMYAIAKTPRERAVAKLRECGGNDGLGRFAQAASCLREGLEQRPLDFRLRSLLGSNLANYLYLLGHTMEARGIANELSQRVEAELDESLSSLEIRAHCRAVLGQCSRVAIGEDELRAEVCAIDAVNNLGLAKERFAELSETEDGEHCRGLSMIAEFGQLEALCFLGRADASEAISTVIGRLDKTKTPGDKSPDYLSALGWGCVFACNIARRHLPEREMHRALAILTNSGYSIADRLGDWSLRERFFSIDFLQRADVAELLGRQLDWSIDEEEVRLIVGTMGRFPSFRPTGWKMLEIARGNRTGKKGS